MIGIGRVSIKGQVVIPADIRKKYGIKYGDKVIVKTTAKGEIVVTKVKE